MQALAAVEVRAWGERWFTVGDAAGGMPVQAIDQPSEAAEAAKDVELRREIVRLMAENPSETFSLNNAKNDL